MPAHDKDPAPVAGTPPASVPIAAVPAARFVCHCTICQAYTGKRFADVTILRAKGVDVKWAETSRSRNIAFLPTSIAASANAAANQPLIRRLLAGKNRLHTDGELRAAGFVASCRLSYVLPSKGRRVRRAQIQ
jgi:hypothetical protein